PSFFDRAPPQRPREGEAPGRGAGRRDGERPVPDVRLARARDDRDVRDPLRGSSTARQAAAARAVRGTSAPQGLPVDVSRGEALAGGRRGRGGRGGVIAQSVFDQWTTNFWLALIIKTLVVLVFFLTAPL